MAINELKEIGTPAPKPESTKHLRVLSNGAVYDMNKHRIVNSQAVTTKFTSETAVLALSKGQEQKREALKRAANIVAEQGGGVDGREMTGDLAYVEAIGEAMAMKAMSVNDPKAVDAARFLFTETGIAEQKQIQEHSAPTSLVEQALMGLIQAITDNVIPTRRDLHDDEG